LPIFASGAFLDNVSYYQASQILHTGRYQDAGGLYKDLMLRQQKVLGAKNDATTKSMSQLAKCLVFQGAIDQLPSCRISILYFVSTSLMDSRRIIQPCVKGTFKASLIGVRR